MTEQQLIDIAKAPTIAYNKKDWQGVKGAMAADCVYDEIATHRKMQGSDQVIEVWKEWAAAFPDSMATFHNAVVSDSTVILELSWRGKNTGPMQMPSGKMPATGKSIDMRACQVLEIKDGKVNSMRQYFDMMTMMQQLGMAKS